MKRKRYTEEQIISILKEHEAGVPAAELCRRHGVSEQSIYRWKTKFGGMEVSDAKRLKELEDENRRLKRMVADLSLDKQMLEDVSGKKVVAPALKRRAAGHLIKTHGISERRACRLLQLHRSVARYRSLSRRDDAPVLAQLKALAQQYPRYGYLMLHHLLRREGLVRNRKRTYRLYTALGLQVRTKRRRKLVRPRVPMAVPLRPNERWSVDFMSDQLSNGRRFRILNLVDDYSRQCVGQIVDFSISGERLARFLDELGRSVGLPKVLVCDNGSELTSKAMFFWSQRSGYQAARACQKFCVRGGFQTRELVNRSPYRIAN